MDTNIIADVVVATHETVGGIDRTTVTIAIIQSITLLLTAVIGIITRIIWKDVNSGRTAMIAEVKSLNKQLIVLEKVNTQLETNVGVGKGRLPERRNV